uniref:tumor necrosis factor ligand superfamily member 15-like n=1 Tax=Pristiophorus japonicus TaxID=55135 RepID=UPI00398F704F
MAIRSQSRYFGSLLGGGFSVDFCPTVTHGHFDSGLASKLAFAGLWLAIASMCGFIFFYIDVLKEDINNQVLTKMKNITFSNFPTTGSDTLKSPVVRAEKPIAHLTALAADFQNTSSRLLFEHTKGHAFNMSDMKYDAAGYLVIPTNGVYFIYAQVTFKWSQGSFNLPHQFSATILRKNNLYPKPEKLLKSCVRPPAKVDDFLTTSTYQAGAFQLDAEDKIYAEVPKNLLTHISVNEYETYFGAFLLEPSTLE